MKILYCHNYYRDRGGEDVSFECDLELLRSRGHTVITYTKDNADLSDSGWKMAWQTVWNRQSQRDVDALIHTERPDILHCNNLFPKISTSVYGAAQRRGIPIVQALRNYRSFCANSFFFRGGKVCTACRGANASWKGVVHKCYRDSRSASAVVVAGQLANRYLHMRRDSVDAYITPTHFSRLLHVDNGYHESRVHTRSNFIVPEPQYVSAIGKPLVFVGRLSREKGVSVLLDAIRKHCPQRSLRIIGGGPESERLRESASTLPNVELLGQLDMASVIKEIGEAAAVVMPSLWFETFGRTIAEAFACGTPVIASRLGAMQELVTDGRNGFLFDVGDADDLARVIARLDALDPDSREQLKREARTTYTERFSPEVSYQQLMKVYESVLSGATASGPGEALDVPLPAFPIAVIPGGRP